MRCICYTSSVKQMNFTSLLESTGTKPGDQRMAKDLEMGYLLDFYGEVLTEKQREMLRQYYNDDLSLSEIGENFGITRQCAGCHQAWRERAEGAGGKGRLCGALPPRAAEAGRAGANGDRCTVRVHRPAGPDHHRVRTPADQNVKAHPLHRRSKRELKPVKGAPYNGI